jgi:hypothetical protein
VTYNEGSVEVDLDFEASVTLNKLILKDDFIYPCKY